MPRNPEIDDAMRTWTSTATERLSALSEAVAHLRKSFEMETETPPEIVAGVATEVITACANLVEWLWSSHAPRGLGKAGGELAAAAGVYRNAAVAFRSLADADVDQVQVRSSACASLLAQGDHHVETFAGIVTKKLGDVTT